MSLSEFQLIQRHFVDSGLGFAKPGVELGIGDDAAVLSLASDSVLTISMDVLVESVHFPQGADPRLIGHRALAVNLSDLAAMAAEPFCFTLGLVLTRADETWLSEFSRGLLEVALRYNCPLVGGDTTKSPAGKTDGLMSISIQVHGRNKLDRITRRDGAKPGDKVYVSGYLGDGAIALLKLGLDSHLGSNFVLRAAESGNDCSDYFTAAYYQPTPRIELAKNCAPWVNSSIDISDGLVADLGHILRASKVGANVYAQAIPYSNSAMCCADEDNRLQAALYGGDDYELCFTVAAEDCLEFEKQAKVAEVQVSCIGEIVDGSEFRLFDSSGEAIQVESRSYNHFPSKVD